MSEWDEKQKFELSDYIGIARHALSPNEGDVMWQHVSNAMIHITAIQTKESEKLLVETLQFKGRIVLSPLSIIPGAMSPEDIMKGMAIETLAKWTGKKYVEMFKRIHDTAESPVLRGIARKELEKLGSSD
ncbi:MAG: hypothetical protein ACFE7R_11875 [Candidatus Hodarchaeota archaeon]